jgi:hypothetical protein
MGRGNSFKGLEAGVVIHCGIERKKLRERAGKTITQVKHNIVLVVY